MDYVVGCFGIHAFHNRSTLSKWFSNDTHQTFAEESLLADETEPIFTSGGCAVCPFGWFAEVCRRYVQIGMCTLTGM